MKNVVVIVAHADDMEFMAGGTVYRLVNEFGYNVSEFILTDNRRGSFKVSDAELIGLSKKEAEEAGNVLGIKEVKFGNFPDGELEEIPRRLLRNILIDYIREKKADVIFGWDPFEHGEDHPDHRCLAMTAYEACSFAANPNFGTPGLYEPHFVSEAYWFAKKPTSANKYVDITGVIEKKIEALLKHETQMELTMDSLILESRTLGIDTSVLEGTDKETRDNLIANAIRAYAENVGKQQGFKYAEVFRYEKLGMLELVIGQELIKPDF